MHTSNTHPTTRLLFSEQGVHEYEGTAADISAYIRRTYKPELDDHYGAMVDFLRKGHPWKIAFTHAEQQWRAALAFLEAARLLDLSDYEGAAQSCANGFAKLLVRAR